MQSRSRTVDAEPPQITLKRAYTYGRTMKPLNVNVPLVVLTSQDVVATPLTVIPGGLKNPSPPKLSTMKIPLPSVM